MKGMILVFFSIASIVLPSIAFAGEADVIGVKVKRMGGDEFSFDVTVRHDDEGWGHYADGWEILGPEGEVLATRKLLHPHVDEQPFTRGISGVNVPEGIKSVTVRAHDKVHGYGGKMKVVKIPR